MPNPAARLKRSDIETFWPELIERFTLHGELPIGEESGFGAVWKAHDTWLDREVAIKISHSDLAAEVKLCRQIEGQTVRVYDYIRRGTWHAYAMELLVAPWTTISRFLDNRAAKRSDLQHYFDCFQVAYGLVKALSAIHGLPYSREGRVVHADIQPKNVFIHWTPKNNPRSVFRLPDHAGVVKIIDLGLSVTKGQDRVGYHPGYSYPNAEEVSPGHDLYSLAMVFLEMVTGSYPGHDTLGHLARIERHVEAHSSGSLYIDVMSARFASLAARAGANRSITTTTLLTELDIFVFNRPLEHLLIMREMNRKQPGPLNKSELAEFLMPAFKKFEGWKNKTKDRIAYLENAITDMQKENLLVRTGHNYSLHVLGWDELAQSA